MHDHDYLHRDIKPANIVVRAADGQPVLIDFGSARTQQGDRTHTQVLTAGYAPIEQYSGGYQGPPSDIYALAAVSYRVLTGNALPSAPDRVLNDDYDSLADSVSSSETPWLAAIEKALALKPQDRPQAIGAWGEALRAEQPATNSGETAKPAPPTRTQTGKSEAAPESLMWVRLAATQGYADAQADLGKMYETGDGLPQDYTKAIKWYRRATKRGNARASRRLGRLYETGTGVPVDKVAAVPLYSRAAELGNQAAVSDLNRLISEGWKGPEAVYQSGQWTLDEVGWREWCRRAAEAGYAEGQVLLASSYANRRLDDPNVMVWRRKAMTWYRRAADQGCIAGQVRLAGMYEGGDNAALERAEPKADFPSTRPSPEDLVEAAKWYRKAAEQEDAEAQARLGHMYQWGTGVPKDDVEAIKWYWKAARQGHREAQQVMGFAYEKGVNRGNWSATGYRGVTRDDVEAYAWFSLSDWPSDHRFAEAAFERLQTADERDRARRLAAKYQEDYVRPFR